MGFVALAYAGWRWGYDSVDGVNSAEWERRRSWYARFAGNAATARPTAPHPISRNGRAFIGGGGARHRGIAA